MVQYWLLILMISVLIHPCAWAADYTITTNARQEQILTRAQTLTHAGLTKLQILNQFLGADLESLNRQLSAMATQDLDNILKIATPPGLNAAINAALSTINAPVVTDIPNQAHNVAQPVAILLQATNPYPDELALTFNATGLPPGIIVSANSEGLPQLSGAPTTAGTYNVTVEAWNVARKKGTDTFQWVINPP